jgi:lysophospholipase L1-like esterase
VKRITLFAKGNVDVHDSLHSCRIGGKLLWNGINELLRTTNRNVTLRLRHETMTRSDALLHAGGRVPEAVVERNLPLGSYPMQSQFSCAIFDKTADAIVLSVQPDVASGMMRHRADGYFLYPSTVSGWTSEDKAWLNGHFDSLNRLSVADSMTNLAAIIGRIRESSEAPILIYNLSPTIAHETIHCYLGLGETLSTRIRRFNIGLAELSEQTGVSIIDVDTIVARYGADALKIDAMHLTPEGYKLVAQEVVRVLDDLGLFEDGLG